MNHSPNRDSASPATVSSNEASPSNSPLRLSPTRDSESSVDVDEILRRLQTTHNTNVFDVLSMNPKGSEMKQIDAMVSGKSIYAHQQGQIMSHLHRDDSFNSEPCAIVDQIFAKHNLHSQSAAYTSRPSTCRCGELSPRCKCAHSDLATVLNGVSSMKGSQVISDTG